jgi:hypothetical protein
MRPTAPQLGCITGLRMGLTRCAFANRGHAPQVVEFIMGLGFLRIRSAQSPGPMVITVRRTGALLALLAVAVGAMILTIAVAAILLIVSVSIMALVLLWRAVLPRSWRRPRIAWAPPRRHEYIDANVVHQPDASAERTIVPKEAE